MLTDKRLIQWAIGFLVVAVLLLLSDDPQKAPQLLSWFVFGSVVTAMAYR